MNPKTQAIPNCNPAISLMARPKSPLNAQRATPNHSSRGTNTRRNSLGLKEKTHVSDAMEEKPKNAIGIASKAAIG
jgi:hypothetical protein